jgi:hypothetical protein
MLGRQLHYWLEGNRHLHGYEVLTGAFGLHSPAVCIESVAYIGRLHRQCHLYRQCR